VAIAGALRASTISAARPWRADSVHEGVVRLREAAGLTARLRGRGVTEADLDTLVAGVSGNPGNDPAGATADPACLRTLYAESL
jgi:alcohol dehydrogenase class IV